MKPVTDPNILMQLNGDGQRQPRPVTDARILMQLDGVPEETANLLGDPRSVWETSGASQLPAIREQVMGGKPLAQAVAAQPPVPKAAQPAPKQQTLSNSDYLTGLMGQAAQGLTLGYFDEGLAAGASALGINDYEENLRRIRGLDKQFVAENPVTSFAANVVGGIPLGGPLTKAGTGLLGAVAPNAARAIGAGTATAGQRVAGGLATGAAAGTVAGSGTAEGDLADRAYGAGMGGLLGAGLGGAIPAVTSAASGAGSAALRAMPFLRDVNLAGYRPFTSAQDRADQLVGQAMARGGDQGAAEAAMSGAVKSQIAQPGTASVADTVLGDVSPELRSLTGAVLRSPGAGAAKAREFIATRQEGIPLANVPGQGSRLADEVSAVGGKINLRDTLDTIVEQRSAAAKPLFDQAFQVGNVINPTLSRIAQDGAVKRALAKGVVLGKRAGDIPPEYKLVIGDTVEAIPARVWHYAKMALDDQISGLRQTGKGVEARSATILKANLINGLDEATGGAYKPALNDFAGRSALLDAAEEGRKAIASNVGPDDIQRMVSGFQTQGERDLFSQAYKSSLANMMASASRTTNAANKALLSDQQVAKIRAAFPADQADEIIKRASVRDAQFRTYAETKGSQTQSRQMAERDIEDNIQSGINLAGAAANPKGYMIGRAMEWLSNVPARAMSEKVRNALAERLVNPDPRKVATALKAVEAAAKREASRLKTVTGNRQFLSRNAAAAQQLGTLGPGVSGAANMVGDAWQKGDTLDRAAMLSSPIPIAGDIAGVANDARNFASGKTPMTAANLGMAALGALPFVPGIAGAVGRGAAKAEDLTKAGSGGLLSTSSGTPQLVRQSQSGLDFIPAGVLDDANAKLAKINSARVSSYVDEQMSRAGGPDLPPQEYKKWEAAIAAGQDDVAEQIVARSAPGVAKPINSMADLVAAPHQVQADVFERVLSSRGVQYKSIFADGGSRYYEVSLANGDKIKVRFADHGNTSISKNAPDINVSTDGLGNATILDALGAIAKSAAKAPEPQGITAYHGSPHTFDKFDMSKIGAGEGNQAYGHGLYFTDTEDIAKGYRDNLVPDYVTLDGARVTPDTPNSGAIYRVAKQLGQAGGSVDSAIADAKKLAASARADAAARPGDAFFRDRVEKLEKAANDLAPFAGKKIEWKKEPGSMYQVRLNVKPDELLDWDKPLAQQSESVRKALQSATVGKKYQVPIAQETLASNVAPGRNAYYDFVDSAKTDGGNNLPELAATERLKAAGIKGIRYLDGNSRGAGQGSYNYVIFDDKLIDILKRYGIPMTAGTGGAMIVMGESMPEELKAQMGGA